MRADLTPHKIVDYLNQYVIGQQDAKKSVAVALRNRWRSRQLALDIAKEISPKNILLIGPTGVGKTEIARRIAALTDAPFVKVEATKYTEIGYVGRDVESMVRDLVEESVRMIKKQESLAHGEKADEQAVLKIADILWPTKKEETRSPMDIIFGEKKEEKPKEKVITNAEEKPSIGKAPKSEDGTAPKEEKKPNTGETPKSEETPRASTPTFNFTLGGSLLLIHLVSLT